MSGSVVSGAHMALAIKLEARDYDLDYSNIALDAIAYCGLRGLCDAEGRQAQIRRNQASSTQFTNNQGCARKRLCD